MFNWLHARRTGGEFVLRIEDTDIKRSSSESEARLLDSLKKLGLTWDEGPDIGGEYGPYRQSEKLKRYEDATRELIESGHVYPCYCSPKELEAERAAMQTAHKPPRYSGQCRSLTHDERESKEAAGARPSYRFRVEGGEVKFTDGVRGEVCFRTRDIGDFIIMRSDGVAAYYLASAVDDLDMAISDVIRGEDHLSNTPKQILIARALGREPPRYSHLPIILNKEGQKLSKRSDAADVSELLADGYLPDALNTAMAMLGWSGVSGEEAESLELLTEKFDITKVSRSPAKYDEARLDNINSKALKAMPPGALRKILSPFLESANFPFEKFSGGQLGKIVDAARDAFGKPSDAVYQIAQFASPLEPDAAAKEILARPETKPVIDALLLAVEDMDSIDSEGYKAVVESVSLKTGLTGKKLYQPIRVAVTGTTRGPKLTDLFCILGPHEIKQRLSTFR